MLLAIFFFVSGNKKYVHVQPTESPMVRVYRVCSAAIANRWRKKHAPPEVTFVPQDADSLHGSELYSNLVKGRVSNTNSEKHDLPIVQTKSYRWLEDAITEWETSQGQHVHVEGLQGHYTPKQVEEVKLVLRLLPVFGATVLYWTIYTQMSVMFVTQGGMMRRQFDWDGDEIHVPAASMAVFNTVAIIMLIWIYDQVFEPFLRRVGYKMTLLKRIGWGMVVAAVAMAAAAAVEMKRLEACHGGSANSPENLSIFWQAPQYALVGLSEVFTSIGQMEFFYDQAPDVMRSCSMALGLLSSALGSYSAGILTWLVQALSEKLTGVQWLPSDLNKGRLDLFFLFMMSLMLLNVFIFLVVSFNYEYKAVEHKSDPVCQVQASQDSMAAGPSTLPPGIKVSSPSYVPIPGASPWRDEEGAEGEDEENLPNSMVYARSLAYQPPQPVRPQTFR
jgi:peptide/histidine transporter 3/4